MAQLKISGQLRIWEIKLELELELEFLADVALCRGGWEDLYCELGICRLMAGKGVLLLGPMYQIQK